MNPYQPSEASVSISANDELRANEVSISDTAGRRPIMLWIICVFLSLIVLASVTAELYLHFGSNNSLGGFFTGWSIAAYFRRYFPMFLLALGVVGFARVKRWAFYVFAGLVILRALYFIQGLAVEPPAGTPWHLYLGLRLLPLVLPLLVAAYAFRLFKNGTLR